MWKKSLKARLTVYVVLPVLITLVSIGGIGFYSAFNHAQDIYDAELSNVANLLISTLHAEDEEEIKNGQPDTADEGVNPDIIKMGTDFDNTDQRPEHKLAFRIWRRGKFLFYSKDAADFKGELKVSGFSNQTINGTQWRCYVLTDDKGDYTVEVAQRFEIRTSLVIRILNSVFLPLTLLLPIIICVVWIGLRRGLEPLISLSDAVMHRSAMDLTPLSQHESLAEIAPLINSINGLLAKIDYALNKERRFTDLAAHELRTPIAIFKTLAQTALKASSDGERQTILQAQVQAADRATNMIDQMLTLARLEHTDIPIETLFLHDLIQTVIQERAPLAKTKNITLNFESGAHPVILGNKDLFISILSNLLDNAIKYTPAHGHVAVLLYVQDNGSMMAVRDSGPGIPEDQLPLVTERFYRVSRQQQGVGLGLTIAKRAAQLMGAALSIQNRPNAAGLEVHVYFPLEKLRS